MLFAVACKSTKIKSHKNLKLNFLSEYVVPDNLILDSTLVGGLSGIDYYKGKYYLACDDANNPRVYEAKIVLDGNQISNIIFEKVISIDNSSKMPISGTSGTCFNTFTITLLPICLRT